MYIEPTKPRTVVRLYTDFSFKITNNFILVLRITLRRNIRIKCAKSVRGPIHAMSFMYFFFVFIQEQPKTWGIRIRCLSVDFVELITKCFWNGILHSRKEYKVIAVYAVWENKLFYAMDQIVTGIYT